MALRVHQLHHVALKAAGVEQAAAFYRDVLGLAERTRHTDEQGLRAIWLEAAGVILMVERSGSSRSPPPFPDDTPGLHLLAFTIAAADREAWRERLAAAGHAIVHETPYTLYVFDPEGNRVGLSSWPEPR